MPPGRPYPGIFHAILMMGGFWALSFAITVPIVVVNQIAIVSGSDGEVISTTSPWLMGIVNLVAFTGVLFWGHAANRVPWNVLVPFARPAAGMLLAATFTSVGLSFVLSEVDNWFREIWPIPEVIFKLFADLLNVRAHPVGAFFALVIVAPLTEELLFRGVILRGLLARHRPAVAIGVSAVLFGVMHLNPWQCLGATILGAVFGWWFVRTRSLVPCILGHALNNGLVYLLAWGGPEIPGYSAVDFSQDVVHQPVWFTALGLALTALGVAWFARATRGGPPPEPVTIVPPLTVNGITPPPLPVAATAVTSPQPLPPPYP